MQAMYFNFKKKLFFGEKIGQNVVGK